MLKFLKNDWILVLALCLLFLMSLPLLYFSNLMKIFDRQNQYAGWMTYTNHPVVGVCLNNLAEDRWMKEQTLMLEEAKNQGVTIQIKVAHHSIARQVQQIANLMAHHVKVLIINPVSREGLKEVLEDAHSRGIKIIDYDELTNGPADLFLGVDYREMGKIQAQTLQEKAGPGNYLIFKGPQNSYRSQMLYFGQQEIFEHHPELNILNVDSLANWSAEEAVNKTRAVITRQKLHGVLAPDDIIAGELVAFFKEQKGPLPIITGAGAEITACQRILQDEQLLTIYFNYSILARTAIKAAKNFAMNKNFSAPSFVMTGNRKIPAYIIPVYPVSKDNLQSFLVQKLQLYTVQEINRDR